MSLDISSSGFFYVPIDDFPVDQLIMLAKKYFESRNKNIIDKESGLGFMPLTFGKINKNQIEYRESFSYRPNMKNFEYDKQFETFFYSLRNKADKIFQEVIESLGLDIENYRGAMSFSTLNISHYPYHDQTRCGIAEHSDWGLLTLLFTDNIGLQIYTNNEWFDVPNIPNHFIVNIGDMLEIISNGRYKSTKHRVITTKEKYSIIFFYEPKLDFLVKPHVSSDNYPEVIFKDYFKSKLDDTYQTKFKL
jgi:isopenicillin N synthase-like dioxygenase